MNTELSLSNPFMSKYMKFKCLEEVEYMNFKTMLINFRKKSTVELFFLCIYLKRRYTSMYNINSLWLSLWADWQIKENNYNHCHLKTTSPNHLIFIVHMSWIHVHVCIKYDASMFIMWQGEVCTDANDAKADTNCDTQSVIVQGSLALCKVSQILQKHQASMWLYTFYNMK